MYHCISEKPGTLGKQIMTLPDEQLTVSNGKKASITLFRTTP